MKPKKFHTYLVSHFRVVHAILAAAFCTGALSSPLKVVVDGKTTLISEADLRKLPTLDVSLKEHDGTLPVYNGPLVSEVLAKAGLILADHVKGKELAAYVLFKASDGYQVAFGLGELEPSISGHNIILAETMNGGPLIASAAPLRLVVEGDKKQARSVRMVVEVDVVHLRK